MRFPNLDKYENNKYQFPDKEGTDPKEKGKEYALETIEAIYGQQAVGNTLVTHSLFDKFEINRRYGAEQQDPSRYTANWSGVAAEPDGDYRYEELKEAMNGVDGLDYSIVSVAGRVKDTIKGMFERNEWNVSAVATDSVSGAEADHEKYRLWVESQQAEKLAEWRKISDQPMPSFDFMPGSIDELDMYEMNGGFKQNYMKALEKIIKHTFIASDWEEARDKYLDDALEVGFVGGRRYVSEDGIVRTRWADVGNIIMQFSEHKDFRDSEYAAEVVLKPVTELMRHGFGREELLSAAKMYEGTYGNPTGRDMGRYDTTWDDLDYNDFKFFLVPVLEAEWFDYDCEYQKEYYNSMGHRRVKPVEFGAEGEGIRVYRERVKYEAKWIIGTKMLYDYGISQIQDGMLSWKVLRVTDKPIIERMRPFLDEMMYAWISYQRGIAQANDPILALNTRLLKNITLADKDASTEEIVEYMEETNRLLYNDLDINNRYPGGDVRPAHLIESPQAVAIQTAMTRFSGAISNIQQITGVDLPSINVAQAPDEHKEPKQMEGVVTPNSIKPILNRVMQLKADLAELVMPAAACLLSESEVSRKAYSDIVDHDDIVRIVQAYERGAKFGIEAVAKPDGELKSRILQYIQAAMQPGRDGERAIEIPDAMQLEAQIESGDNLRQIAQIVGYKIELYKRQRQEQAMQAQQANDQKQVQIEQYKAQMKQQEESDQFERERVLQSEKYQGEFEVEKLKQDSETLRARMELEQEQSSDKMDMRQQLNNRQ